MGEVKHRLFQTGGGLQARGALQGGPGWPCGLPRAISAPAGLLEAGRHLASVHLHL